MSLPEISVVIPTYNRGALIDATVESVLCQDLPADECEILIVDDGSTDGTWEFLQKSYGSLAQVRLLRQANGGVASARNLGLQQARGEFIAFLDHDDLWLPAKLGRQRALLRANPRLSVAYCLWSESDETGRLIEGHETWMREPSWTLPRGNVVQKLLRNNFIVSMSVPLMRTRDVRACGGFDPRAVPCDDWDLWMRLSHRGEFDYVPEVLLTYRRHSSQQSLDEDAMWRASQRVLFKQSFFLLLNPRVLWIILTLFAFMRTNRPNYDLAKGYLLRGQWWRARREMRLAFRRYPLMVLFPQWIYLWLRLQKRDSRPF